MTKLLVSIGVGAVAGIIDVIPMLMQKLDKFSNWSAFVHWVVLGVIISYIQVPLAPWLKGFVVAECCVLPVIILVAKTDCKSIVSMVVMSAILGIAVGVATAKIAV